MIVTEFESTNFYTFLWWEMSLGTLACAILVVTLNDLIKAALALIGTFLGIAGFFILLHAEFLATVQTLIYVGAVSILIIFGVLMVQDVKRASSPNRFRIPAFILLAGVFSLVASAVILSEWNSTQLNTEAQNLAENVFASGTPVIGRLLFSKFPIALELAAFVLMTSLVGAISIMKGERE